MASLAGENQTTVFITGPQLSSLSIALGFQQDVTKKREDEKVLESQKTILLRTDDLEQDVTTKEEDQQVVQKLKKELEAKYRKVYMLRLFTYEMIFEMDKISFRRAMEKAWFINSIIKERCLYSCDHSGGDLIHHEEVKKVMEFNKKIKLVICLGLDDILFGRPSNKRKRSSYEAHVEEAFEEYDENLMNCKETSLEMVHPPEDTENFGNYCKKTYRRAYPFSKLESREDYLESVINSLREREAEREREIQATENEILGYMLLQEIVNSTLHNTSRELLGSVTLSSASADGDEGHRNIDVEFNEQFYTEHANAKSNFEKTFASSYNAFVINAKSACNNCNSEVEQIKQMLAMVEVLIREGNENLVMDKHYQNVWSVERRYERELLKYCEDLSYYMRLGRRLNPLTEIEKDRLKQIGDLARDATKANGPDPLPTITQPLLPTWRSYYY